MQLRILLLCALLTGCLAEPEPTCGIDIREGTDDLDIVPYNLTAEDLKALPEIAQAFAQHEAGAPGSHDVPCDRTGALVRGLEARGAEFPGNAPGDDYGRTVVSYKGEPYAVFIWRLDHEGDL